MIGRDGANIPKYPHFPGRDLTVLPCFSFPLKRDFLYSGILHNSPFSSSLRSEPHSQAPQNPKTTFLGLRGAGISHTWLGGAVRFSHHLLMIGKQFLFPLFPRSWQGRWNVDRGEVQPPPRPAAALGDGLDKRAGFPVSPTHPSQGIQGSRAAGNA